MQDLRAELASVGNREEFLRLQYPEVYLSVLRRLGDAMQASEYITFCLSQHDTNFSLYFHGYFVPWINQQKKLGLINKGKCSRPPHITIREEEFNLQEIAL